MTVGRFGDCCSGQSCRTGYYGRYKLVLSVADVKKHCFYFVFAGNNNQPVQRHRGTVIRADATTIVKGGILPPFVYADNVPFVIGECEFDFEFRRRDDTPSRLSYSARRSKILSV